MPSRDIDPEPQSPAPPERPSVLARLGLHDTASRLAVATVAAFVAASAGSIGAASEILTGAKDWVVGYFDWLFVGVATSAIVAVGVLAVHPRANVRLGPDDSRPEFGNLSWFAMLFSAGLASGLLYWATAEPILHAAGTIRCSRSRRPAAPFARARRDRNGPADHGAALGAPRLGVLRASPRWGSPSTATGTTGP